MQDGDSNSMSLANYEGGKKIDYEKAIQEVLCDDYNSDGDALSANGNSMD